MNISEAFDDSNMLQSSRIVQVVNSGNHKPIVTGELLAKRWGIGLELAFKTIQVTMQRGIRNVTGPLELRLKTKQAHSRYPHLGGRHGRFYTDAFFSFVPTLRSCESAQLFTNDVGFMKVAKELMECKFKKICRDYGIKTSYSEPHSPWQNRAEANIRELKRPWQPHRALSSQSYL